MTRAALWRALLLLAAALLAIFAVVALASGGLPATPPV